MTVTLQTIVPILVDVLLGRTPDTTDRAGAVEIVNTYADDESRANAWTGVDKAAYCRRLAELVRTPNELNQAGTFFCAPAAVLYAFARSYPKRFAQFGVDLLSTGRASLGSRSITMTNTIREQNITEWVTTKNWGIQLADLLLILAIQEDMTFLNINDPSSYALAPPVLAGSFGSDVRKTLNGSGLFDVVNLTASAAALRDALEDPNAIVIAVGSMPLFSQMTLGRHVAVFVPPLTIDGTTVKYRFWSWGTVENHNSFPLVGGKWRDGTTTQSAFNSQLDKAMRVRTTGADLD